jgi:hypothetical protein
LHYFLLQKLNPQAINNMPNDSFLFVGDIILQDSGSTQGPAIKAATGSDFTHCGIFFLDEESRDWVAEAVQPVKRTRFREFVEGGTGGSYTVMRHRDYPNGLPANKLTGMREWLRGQMGKNYDGKFLWDDLRLYCSELVWKAYDAVEIKVCDQIKVGDLNLKHPTVQVLIERRFGSMDRVPLNEPIVPPSALATSGYLFKVHPNQP